MVNPLYLQHGKPTLLATRIEGFGFQSVMEGIDPDFDEAWGSMGDEYRDLIAHLAVQVLIDGHTALRDFQSGASSYHQRHADLGAHLEPDELLTKKQITSKVLAELAILPTFDHGWDPSMDLQQRFAIDPDGRGWTFQGVRHVLEPFNTSEANRVLKRLQSGKRTQFRAPKTLTGGPEQHRGPTTLIELSPKPAGYRP